VTETPEALHLRVERPMTSAGGHLPWGGVDIDVHHDDDGLPGLRRSTLNARLGEVCLEFLPAYPDLADAAARLFGRADVHEDIRVLSVRDAWLPARVARILRSAVTDRRITRYEALDAVTAVITTTAIDATGAPRDGSRRDIRAVRPGVTFVAELRWLAEPTDTDLTCLARAVLGLHQIGLGGSRGRGLVTATLDGDATATHALARLDPRET
jgi:CRISPR/Cas system CSM-associated protein Csm3 (group 7 of RAMP superfamily)